MTVLIIGYPDSGKSGIAENIVTQMSAPGERIYLATMIPFGEEGRIRVEKHRNMRKGKGFLTIEEPFDPSAAIGSIDDISNKTVLLECLSNLIANEMFERHSSGDKIIKKLTEEILEISEKVRNLVIVSNSFRISSTFDEETVRYAQVMEAVNSSISSFADKTIRL